MSEEKKPNPEELQNKIKELEKQKNEYLAGWQKARADLLNYKREEMERVGDILNYAAENLILKILPILDNFEIAEKNLKNDFKNEEQIKGILQIKSQLQDFLKTQGVEQIEAIGKKFDPNFHEAVEDLPSDLSAETLAKAGAEVKESGIIVEEIQKGYKINDRLLRPAKVRVAK